MASHAFELQENLSQLPWSPGSPGARLIPTPAALCPSTTGPQTIFVSYLWELVCSVLSLECLSTLLFFPLANSVGFFSRPSSDMATFGIPWSAQSPCTPARSQESLLHAPGTLPTPQHLAPGSRITDGPASLFHCARKSQEVRTLP